MNKKGQYHQALIWGFILLMVFGGLLPLILKDFHPESSDISGYLSPFKNIIKFYTWGNFETFLLNQLNGFSVIPLIIAVPLLLLTFGLLTYGMIKILPETEIGSIIAASAGILAVVAAAVGAVFGGGT